MNTISNDDNSDSFLRFNLHQVSASCWRLGFLFAFAHRNFQVFIFHFYFFLKHFFKHFFLHFFSICKVYCQYFPNFGLRIENSLLSIIFYLCNFLIPRVCFVKFFFFGEKNKYLGQHMSKEQRRRLEGFKMPIKIGEKNTENPIAEIE